MRKIIPIFVPHQGCPHRCVFCHQPHITGISIHTSMTPDTLRRRIETALNEPKSKAKGVEFEVAFYGGTFTGLQPSLQEQFLKTAQTYVDRGDLTGIRLSTHPKMFNNQIFTMMDAFSVTAIELGVQSFDNRVLEEAGRGHSAEEAEQTIIRLQHMGIAVGIHLMIGLPGDSREGSLRSAEKAITLHPASIRIHPTLVIRHTQLARLYQQGGYEPLSLEEAVQICKKMLIRFRAHQIPVIRIGLQPTMSMEQNIIAGPYHPAFRQLVESAAFYDKMKELCAAGHCVADTPVTFAVAPQDLSTARGQKNTNIEALRQEFGLTHVQIVSDNSLQRGEIAVVD